MPKISKYRQKINPNPGKVVDNEQFFEHYEWEYKAIDCIR
jgi:hypothetical protein